jgi:hypothetical protein
MRAPLKELGGGIAPAAIGALIEATCCSVNAYKARWQARTPVGKADKVLTRLDFLTYPVIAGAFRPAAI